MYRCMHAKLLQLHLTLCDPVDRSPPGSSVHGISQARILEPFPTPVCIHNSKILFSPEKEGNPAICDNIDEPGRYYPT